jgi:phospholipid/cholesterol/gamma-HCH transport system permease protein
MAGIAVNTGGDRRADDSAAPSPPARWLQPAATAADLVELAWAVARCLVTRPTTWWREFVLQSSLVINRCALPLAVSGAFMSIAVNLTITVGALRSLGADDRSGSVAALLSLREFGAWVTGMIIAGVAGTAICSDLGARRVREELDALAVLGVDAVRSLVLPRVLAVAVVAPLLYLWGVFWVSGTAVVLGPAVAHLDAHAFIDTYQTLLTIDIYAGLVKLAIIGLLTGLVSCLYGLSASGGPEGVGRNVNRAVVICFAVTWGVSLLFNAFYLAAFPQAQDLR